MPLPLVLAVTGPRARGEARSLAAASLLGVVGVGLELARPWPLALAIDYAIVRKPFLGMSSGTLLLVAGICVVLLTAVAGLVEMAAVVCAERAAERIGAKLRQDVFERSMSLSLRWHDRIRTGELISRLTTDVGRLLDALVAISSSLLPDAVRLIVVVLVLAFFNPWLALVALAVLPVLMVFAVRQRRLVRQTQQDARAESGRLVGAATDLVRNVRAVQAFSRATRASSVFDRRNQAVLDVNLRAVTTEARWAPVADIVLAIGTGLVLVVGGRQVLDGDLSAGALIVVTAYLSSLYGPVRGLSRLSGVLAKSTASAARVREVLDCGERVTDCSDAHAAPRISRQVQLRSVRFGYQSDRPVLDDFDLTVDAGETVCLLGPSGAGKSTILHLLLRLYDVDAGAVLLDGVDVRDMTQQSLRRRIAFVPQDPWLFDASVAENIAFGTPRATLHGIRAAGRAALVDEFVGQLPAGYDTLVGEGAVRLSGGQRRRIALARAEISGAPLVLLDEPTASLDQASASSVVAAIQRSTVGRTVLIVTHDRDLAALADRVVVLDRRGSAGLAWPNCPYQLRGGESHDHDQPRPRSDFAQFPQGPYPHPYPLAQPFARLIGPPIAGPSPPPVGGPAIGRSTNRSTGQQPVPGGSLMSVQAASWVGCDLDDDGQPVSHRFPGDDLPGGCRAADLLGVGHRCETWLGWSPRLWCYVVVKLPRPHQRDHPRARRSLEREVSALVTNLHPALPRLYEDGSQADSPYLVFEYVDGPALDEEIDDRGAFAPLEVALLGAELLSALQAVHDRGVAHIDVKPENIVLRAGRPVLLDFGSSRAIGAPQPPGKLIGSPGYASPDLEAGAPISTAMDVYGIGVTLLESLTGVATFDPDFPAADRPDLPSLGHSALTVLLRAMLEVDPARRPTVAQAWAELATIAQQSGDPVSPAWVSGAISRRIPSGRLVG